MKTFDLRSLCGRTGWSCVSRLDFQPEDYGFHPNGRSLLARSPAQDDLNLLLNDTDLNSMSNPYLLLNDTDLNSLQVA